MIVQSHGWILFFVGLLLKSGMVFAQGNVDGSDNFERPNVVFIMCDDLGYGEISALNLNPDLGKIPTPHIDQLIEHGMTFTDAHSGSSVCTPTRYGLLTGRYAWRTTLQKGVVKGHDSCLISAETLTMAEMLRQEGYVTGIVGKWHLNYIYADPQSGKKLGESLLAKKGTMEPPVHSMIKDGPLDHGFDYFFGYHHSGDMRTVCENDQVIAHRDPITMLPAIEEKSIRFINRHAESAHRGNPFFLYVPLSSPHAPLVPTRAWQGKSGLNEHADFVMQTDHTVGQIVKAIDDNGLGSNTLIVFTADNGTSARAAREGDLQEMGHFSSWILRGSKADIWEGGHRLPFMVRWPAVIEGGSTSDALICHTDFMPTMADILGVHLPDDAAVDGFSYAAVFSTGQRHEVRAPVIHHSISGRFAIRKGRWKLVLCPGSGGWSDPGDNKAQKLGYPDIQLYDMEADIREQHNVQADHPEVVHDLIKELEEMVDNGRSTVGKPLDNDVEGIDIWKGVDPVIID